MKRITRLIIVLSCLIALMACGSLNRGVSLEKDGIKYEIKDESTFYYPNTYELDVKSSSAKGLDFVNKNDEFMFYRCINDRADNPIEQLDELFTGELEQKGATSVAVETPKMSGGQMGYQYTGILKNSGMKFMIVCYFTSLHTYIYGYLAKSETYDRNADSTKVFLQSLSVVDQTK